MNEKLTPKQIQSLKYAYAGILNYADLIDVVLEGSIFKEILYELIEKQAKELEIDFNN